MGFRLWALDILSPALLGSRPEKSGVKRQEKAEGLAAVFVG